jgi:hypothetical protein
VNALARVTLVCVLAQIVALCDLESFGGDDLVERVGGAGELFAGVAVAGYVVSSAHDEHQVSETIIKDGRH